MALGVIFRDRTFLVGAAGIAGWCAVAGWSERSLPGAASTGVGFACLGVGAVLALVFLAASARFDPRNVEERAPKALPRGIAFLIFAFGLAVNLFRLDQQLSFDEIWTWDAQVRRPLGVSIWTYASDNNHPLYSLMAWTTTHVIADDRWSLRLPAALFGAGNVLLTAQLGSRATSRREGALAGAVLALAYHHVFFSQNARGYTALLFFTLLSTLALFSALDGGGRRARLLHGTALALGLYVHLTAVFVVVAQALLYLGWAIPRRKEPRRALEPLEGFLWSGVLSFLLYAPMLEPLVEFFRTSSSRAGYFQEKPTWKSPLWTLRAAAESFGHGVWVGSLAMIAAAGVILTGMISYFRRDRRLPILLVLAGAVATVLLLALNRNLWPRFYFFLGGFGVLLLVRGVLAIVDAASNFLRPNSLILVRTLRTAAFAAVFAVELTMTRSAWFDEKQDFDGAVAWIEKEGLRPSTVTCALTTFVYRFYYGEHFLAAVETPGELEDRLRRDGSVHVLLISPNHLASWSPELWKRISSGREVARFPGTTGRDQDVVVVEIER